MSAESEVALWVYDISHGMARQFGQMIVGTQMDGIWHSGLAVYGMEYFFSGGAMSLPCGQFERNYNIKANRVIPLGKTKKKKTELDAYIDSIRHRFTESTYDLLSWNCNHFTNELSLFLLDTPIPDYILKQAEIVASTPTGRMLLPMMQQQQQSFQQQAQESGLQTLWTRGESMNSVNNNNTNNNNNNNTNNNNNNIFPSNSQGYSLLSDFNNNNSPQFVTFQNLLYQFVVSLTCSSEERHSIYQTLDSIINNILKNPEIGKYKKIKKNNLKLSKIIENETGLSLLKSIGFEEKVVDENDSFHDKDEEEINETEVSGVNHLKRDFIDKNNENNHNNETKNNKEKQKLDNSGDDDINNKKKTIILILK